MAILMEYQLVTAALGVMAALMLVQILVGDVLAIRARHIPGAPVEADHNSLLFRATRVVAKLRSAVAEIERGLIDADLGGAIYKQRIPAHGAGKRGGGRALIVFRAGDRAVFVYGFLKAEESNISQSHLIMLKRLAKQLLSMNELQIEQARLTNELIELNP